MARKKSGVAQTPLVVTLFNKEGSIVMGTVHCKKKQTVISLL